MFGVQKEIKKIQELWIAMSNTLVGRTPEFIIDGDDILEIYYDFEISEENMKKLKDLAHAISALSGIYIFIFPRGYIKYNWAIRQKI